MSEPRTSELLEETCMTVVADVVVTNRSGLHARPAAELSRLAAACSSTVTLRTGDRIVNAASVLSLMAAGIEQGQRVTIECDGDDAQADLARIVAAIESGLGE